MTASLFSLEVVVNFVKLQHEKVSCLFPCVAFRLLDYPSIAIHLLDDIDAKELKSKLEINLSYQPDLKLTHFRDLLDKHGRYIFAKGKSCLIRSDLDTLRGHLRNAPLYVMLLDAYHNEFKLVGASSMPLTNIMEEIYKELHETDLDMPCTKITHGVFDIKNLMNEEIGCISFACRLSSFGSTLLPHIGVTNEAIERQNQLKAISSVKNKQISSQNEIINTVNKNQSETRSKQLNSALVQTIPIDYKTAQIQISNADLLPEKVDSSTQMYEKINIKTNNVHNIEVKTKKVVEDEFVFDQFCPPPLYYNSEIIKKTSTVTTTTTTTTAQVATAVVQNIKTINERKQAINEYEKKRIAYLNEAIENQVVALPDGEIVINEEIQNECDEGYISSQQQHVRIKSKVEAKQQNAGFNLDDFPILKCLVDEISKLKSLGERGDDFRKPTKQQPIEYPIKSPRPKSALLPNTEATYNRRVIPKSAFNKPNSRIVGILKDKNKKQPPKFTKETMIESVNRLSRPKSAKTQNDVIEQEVELSEQESKPKPKTKLKYNITNTHRMRVLASRPGKVDEINDEHLSLIKKLKQNLDEITDSSQNVTPRSSLKKSQKDYQMQINHMSISDSTYNNSIRSPLDLSLLNKVEMESTIDYALSRNLLNNMNGNSQDNVAVKNSLQQSSNPQTGQSTGSLGGQNTKFVQFGNTYVFNHPSDESATTPVANTNTSTTTTSTYSPLNQVIKNPKQLQIPFKKSQTLQQRKSPRSQTTSSLSSSKSKQTSDDFEEDDDDDNDEEDAGMSIKMSQININSDDIDHIIGTSSKYSSNDFHSESKSKDDRNFIEDETIFSRDSRTSTTD